MYLYVFGAWRKVKVPITDVESVYSVGVDIFAQQILLVPLHLTSHWALAFCELEAKTISIYDSLPTVEKGICELTDEYVSIVGKNSKKSDTGQYRLQLKKESDPVEISDRRNEGEEGAGPKHITMEVKNHLLIDGPKQQNTYDCGIFMCQFAKHLSCQVFSKTGSLEKEIGQPFDQTQMENFRASMRIELSRGKLLE
ncbi:sentrin-specific protease 1-like [Hetaerina americana]|uniref:sentrin-specific protease 1-like n=1 Tax=Hetaerina americana TaxID=62018 RepID=UPI003A7F170E